MDSTVKCHQHSYLPIRFYDHLRLAVWPNVQTHDKNLTERAGDLGLWPQENAHRLKHFFANPEIVAIGLTAIALISNSYLFYPAEIVTNLRWAFSYLPEVPFWAVKFSAYMLTCETITSIGARALGRFSNQLLMNEFYNKNEPTITQEISGVNKQALLPHSGDMPIAQQANIANTQSYASSESTFSESLSSESDI